ncbi:MAG TPA: ATP-binding protein [Caulobacteraceae bacterium]|nr:ATP-binding protein [Caulobacteraceae bacterium]
MSTLMVLERLWLARRTRDPSGRGEPGEDDRFNPFDWLANAGYSVAAFYLVLFYTGAAQTFGVTLYGVVMFQILVRDYAAPRRLLTSLVAPLFSMTVVQCAAIALRIAQGHPLQIVTVLASPYIVLRVFRAVQDNLTQARARERAAAAESRAGARQITEAHRIAILAEQLAGVGHWRYDIASRAAVWSDGVTEICGFDPSAPAPSINDLITMFSPSDGAHLRELLRRSLRDGEPFKFEARLKRPDGQVRHVAGNGAVERAADGQVVTIFGAFMDVTEARLREEALSASEAQFRMLADHSTDIVIWINLDGTIHYASPSAKSVGYMPEDLIGRKTIEFVHPDDRERALEGLLEQSKGNPLDGAIRREYRVRTGDGRYVWLEGIPTYIRDEQGRATSVVTSYRDVSARRRLEDDLLEAKLRAEAATEAKAEFLANMSHEIRTPLTGILGFSGLLGAMDQLPSRAMSYIQRIETSGQSLLSVVNDILDFSKLESGQVRLDPQPFAVEKLFEQTIELFAAQAAVKAIELDLTIDETVPRTLEADGWRLRQVLNNLVSNAIKFTEKGSVGVCVGYDELKAELRVTVSDTGVGVPADKLDRLFQRFSQVDGSVSRRHGGTGLGLSICRSLVELMGGEIGVRSVVGKGSMFEFRVRAEPAVERATSDLLGRPDFDSERPARILVVDDLDVNRELIRAILESIGQEVEEAAGGEAALSAASRSHFDLVLMDLQMPGMDGFAAARAIRRLANSNRFTPIVALSANVLPEHVEASAAAGMNDHLGKPIVPLELIGAVAKWSGSRLDDRSYLDRMEVA